MAAPRLLAMLMKQGIEGDDALLQLAQARLQEAGLGAELYPATPEQLREQLDFCPAGLPCTVHLPRNLNLLTPEARARVQEFAQAAAGRAYGLIVHDHIQFADRTAETLAAFRHMDLRLDGVGGTPRLFVEYAAGLPPDAFAALFEQTGDLRHVSACVDVSHVGIRVCQLTYAQAHPGTDVCSLKTAPDLAKRLDFIEQVVAEALPAVVGLVRRLARLGRPLHFHLHDGHPLSTLSRYGVSDHLSFLQPIPIPCEWRGRRIVRGMFGPSGLRAIVQAALAELPPERLSFMIEVHPQEGRLPLGRHAAPFGHWKDLSNAERMNYWLEMLVSNGLLLQDACQGELVATRRGGD